jgi:hypothetical protein
MNNNKGSALSLDNSDNPQPNRHEPVITLSVSLLEASPIIFIGNKSLNHLKLSLIPLLTVDNDKFISVTSSMYLPIDSLPSGDRIPGF